MDFVLAYITAGSKEEALRIGRALVGERLAACANVLDGMTSVYRWNGAVEEAPGARPAQLRHALRGGGEAGARQSGLPGLVAR